MRELFDRTRDFRQDTFRNIVSLRESQDLFDDLADGDPLLSRVAAAAEMRVKEQIPPGIVNRGFHYSLAIGYPFETEPFMASRYGDGTFGVWYGSLDLETTIFETGHHMLTVELGIEGLREVVIRERAVYLVYAEAILLDLVGREKNFPLLVADDYSFTQAIGKRVSKEGHPGLLAPSARCKGVNIVAFNPAILRDPRPHCYLTYHLDPAARTVTVERQPGETLLVVP